ncbi:MAG: Cof-type HAD-IIB family hydrolase [Neisseria sp.]|uniref:Cof-type HAD-IIB family hydrolase n=1 Tax=Neisseria sp. TaxID=192066 RepID=UPI0026DBC149|nr:Cof-type HAD-IIB family hydrolase [Neisseria sp.]MDO4249476.1 Cof-type HAD-IIB family hydrolase [Neisseria sp.]
MQKQQPKIIFFDIDDTLYIKDERRIAESTRNALQALKEQGIITAIATGRGPSVLPEAIKQLMAETGMELLVSINGQFVRYRGEALATFPLASSDIAETGKQMAALGIAYACVTEHEVYVSYETEALVSALSRLGVAYRIGLPEANEPVYQMLAFYPQSQDNVVETVLPASLKTVRWHEQGVDFLAAEGSKARGIQAALDKLGLTMQDAMAFGDGLNDKEMMQAVGFGVVMDNGHPELKALADYICPAVTEDGIYRGLQALGVIEAAS